MSASRRKSRIAAFRPIPGSGSRLLQFDPAGLLETESDIAVYLSEALMDDTVQGILHSFFTACRARGIGPARPAAAMAAPKRRKTVRAVAQTRRKSA